ncbi:MAG: radical SAM family heme chaperone HemW [Actinomycetota bacterium]|nr:radical SAM family heme chaperone HemW [Actinomycetota bacterium]
MSVVAAPTKRSGDWLTEPGFGIYVHIPFCAHRCHYCDFNTYEGQDALHRPYVDALIADIHGSAVVARPATSVFFGGGTPTLLPPGDLALILDAVRTTVGIAPDAEITVEANPETVDEAYFEALLIAGFNRVSLGIQSLAPGVLAALGRTHSATRGLDALAAARSAGFADVNADLIYGSPWEKDGDWHRSLEGVIAAGPQHVSAYALTVEAGTPLATMVATGRVPDVDPDVQADRHVVADAVLGAAGYERYEISNWAKPGHACAHNLVYWCAGDYLGFGAGAHGHLDGTRYWNTRLPRDFIAAVTSGATTRAGEEHLHNDERAGEALMLGLRLSSGVDLVAFEARFGRPSIETRRLRIEALITSGLVELADRHLRLTARGTMLANEVQSAVL